MYTRTENQIKKAYAKKRKETAQFIKRGYFPDWAEEHRHNPENGLRRYLTAAKWAAYEAGKIDRKKAVELATAQEYYQHAKHATDGRNEPQRDTPKSDRAETLSKLNQKSKRNGDRFSLSVFSDCFLRLFSAQK